MTEQKDSLAQSDAASEVQDTWLVGGEDLKAMSGSIDSDRVIQLHFKRRATDKDREWLLKAINAQIKADREAASLTPAASDEVVARCRDMLGDVPGEDLEAKVTKIVGDYLALQIMLQEARAQVEDERAKVKLLADRIVHLTGALSSAAGYLKNADIDLATGARKATAQRTIQGGIKMVEAALVLPDSSEHSSTVGGGK